MIGQKFGRWTILGKFRKDGIYYFECRCDCGTVRNVRANSIRSGRSKSCGCLLRERAELQISVNNKKQIDNNAQFNTCFQIIEREKPHKNNKSGHKGVYWEKTKGVWRSVIYVHKKCIYLGSFHDIKDAIKAREVAEKEYFLPLIEAKRVSFEM